MSVKTGEIENAERDLELANRETKTRRVAAATDPGEQLQALRQRIAAGMSRPPEGAPIPECRACYRRGWMEALKSLEERG
jgi:hypothetical protein